MKDLNQVTEQDLYTKIRQMATNWRGIQDTEVNREEGFVLINSSADEVIGWTYELASDLVHAPFREYYGTYAVDIKGTIYQALGRTSDGMARYWQRINRVRIIKS